MSLIKNLKRVGLILTLCLLFSTNTKANSIEMIETTETFNFHVDSEITLDCLYNENNGPGWDKFKEAVKEFLDGVLDGMGDGLGGVANQSGGGFNQQELRYMETFARNTIRTRAEASELMYGVQKLILFQDSDVITKDQLARVFKNDQRMMEIITGGEDIFPIDKNVGTSSRARSFWGKLGYAVGRVIAILILSNLP